MKKAFYMQQWGGGDWFLTTKSILATHDRFAYDENIKALVEKYGGELRDVNDGSAFVVFSKEEDGNRFIEEEINPVLLMRKMAGEDVGSIY